VVAVVGLVRFAPEFGAVRANAARILDHAAAAAGLGAAVVVFPLWAVSGVAPKDAGAAPNGIGRQAQDAVTWLALAASRQDLGGRYLLVGVHGWLAGGRPQLSTVLLHQGKVGLAYSAGWPDPMARPWEGAHRVEGELAVRGSGHLSPVFAAHGASFGVELAGTGVEPNWPSPLDRGSQADTGLDAVLTQRQGGALVTDREGRRLSPLQPDHEGLTLWHTVD
jgi:predicted amidohydrolase